MSKKPNPAIIGTFILGTLALGVCAIILFSSWNYFGRRESYILYFDTSVKGLSPGAPVKYRGVTVGWVREILIRHNQRASDVHIPVIIIVDESVIRKKTDRTIDLSDDAVFQPWFSRDCAGYSRPKVS